MKNEPLKITEACQDVLDQVADVINQLSDQEFIQPVEAFNGSTLGQHIRHSLEFFLCLMEGYDKGLVNYDKRSHDQVIETSRDLTLEVINRVKLFVSKCNTTHNLILQVSYDRHSSDEMSIETNLNREIIYNIEHVIHHMALVKIGIREVCPSITLPDGFGIAVSTLKFRKQQEAQ